MDIVEAINKRQSIRGFKPDPVPQATIREIMELSLRAPSWGNTQPWDFYIVAGKPLEEIKNGFTERAGQPANPDVGRPQEFPEPYGSRRRPPGSAPPPAPPAGAQSPSAAPGQAPPRPPMNPRFYEAPCLIYLCTGRSFYYQSKVINAFAIYDLGLISENIMLLAPNYGLGTIALAQAVTHPEVVRKVLNIPESLLIVLGIAIGYPDWDNPRNKTRSAREPLDKVAKWVGF